MTSVTYRFSCALLHATKYRDLPKILKQFASQSYRLQQRSSSFSSEWIRAFRDQTRSDLGFARANLASRNGELQWDCRLHQDKNAKQAQCSEMQHTKGLKWRPVLLHLQIRLKPYYVSTQGLPERGPGKQALYSL